MDDLRQQVTVALQEIGSTGLKRCHNIDEAGKVMREYDMIFHGEKFNKILSVELRHTLKNKFKVELTTDDLNKMLPSICKSLGMTIEPLISANDAGNPNPEVIAYSITIY